jgi:DNA-binding NarL/FixJ family response regulator
VCLQRTHVSIRVSSSFRNIEIFWLFARPYDPGRKNQKFQVRHATSAKIQILRVRGLMVYSVFVQLGDGAFITVASCDDFEQAIQIVDALSASWPRKYVVRDSNGNEIYVKEHPPTLSSLRILVVDDFKDWRNQVRLLLQERPKWHVISEATDGLEAVQKAGELKPDLILLDIGLPKLNGIEAARRMRELSPISKIVFLSMEKSLDVVQMALSTGAQGYVHKASAQGDLLAGIDAVLRGEQFVSSALEGTKSARATGARIPRRHAVQFYSDDRVLLDRLVRFVAEALKTGGVAIVIASESHRAGLFQRLKREGSNVDAAIREGRYIPLDAVNTLSLFMINGMLDSARFLKVVGGLVEGAAKTGKIMPSRVAVFGEWVSLLGAEGKWDTAVRIEQLWNQLATTYEIDLLCGYSVNNFHGEKDELVLERIRAEHSAVFSEGA